MLKNVDAQALREGTLHHVADDVLCLQCCLVASKMPLAMQSTGKLLIPTVGAFVTHSESNARRENVLWMGLFCFPWICPRLHKKTLYRETHFKAPLKPFPPPHETVVITTAVVTAPVSSFPEASCFKIP